MKKEKLWQKERLSDDHQLKLTVGLKTFRSKNPMEVWEFSKSKLHQKQVGKNSRRFHDENIATFEKLVEYRCFTPNQNNYIFSNLI